LNKLQGSGLEDIIATNTALEGRGFRFIRGGTTGVGTLGTFAGIERASLPDEAVNAPPYVPEEPISEEEIDTPPPTTPPSPPYSPILAPRAVLPQEYIPIPITPLPSRASTPEPLNQVVEDVIYEGEQEDVEEEEEVERMLE
jgi:hypothetical protein